MNDSDPIDLASGMVWCEWCDDHPSLPGVPCESCKQLGAEPILSPSKTMTTYFHWNEGNAVYPLGAWHLAGPTGNLPRCGEPARTPGLMEYVIRESDAEPKQFCRACHHMHHGYTVTQLAYGQPRKLADSDYKWRVFDTAEVKRGHDEVLAFCREHLRNAEGFAPSLSGYIAVFKEEVPGRWLYHVIEPYAY